MPGTAEPGKQGRPTEAEELLPAPSRQAQELIGRHLAEEHDIRRFRLDEHVYLGGKRRPSQHISWDPARASFHCDLCPHVVFSTGEVTPEQVTLAQQFDRALDPFLVGARTQKERDEITRRYLGGELSAAVLEVARKTSRRRPVKQARPAVEHRKARVQAWMLAEYAERGVFERVFEEALRLQREHPERWAEVCDLQRADSTLRRYWQQIDDDKVEAARRAFERRRS